MVLPKPLHPVLHRFRDLSVAAHIGCRDSIPFLRHVVLPHSRGIRRRGGSVGCGAEALMIRAWFQWSACNHAAPPSYFKLTRALTLQGRVSDFKDRAPGLRALHQPVSIEERQRPPTARDDGGSKIEGKRRQPNAEMSYQIVHLQCDLGRGQGQTHANAPLALIPAPIGCSAEMSGGDTLLGDFPIPGRRQYFGSTTFTLILNELMSKKGGKLRVPISGVVPQSLGLKKASKRRNTFCKNKKQETTEIGTRNLPPMRVVTSTLQ
ncbi:hypothetical protein AAG570_008312 [Ranatra chinensis]|uniref:Uncharacterized protein n=1 Tax=Ranatra chinensis TaxID=642074 RepID=A0ABD0XUS9_9HEMI